MAAYTNGITNPHPSEPGGGYNTSITDEPNAYALYNIHICWMLEHKFISNKIELFNVYTQIHIPFRMPLYFISLHFG